METLALCAGLITAKLCPEGVGVAVGVLVGVGDWVGAGVDVGVTSGVGVTLGVPVGATVGVGVGVGVAPMGNAGSMYNVRLFCSAPRDAELC